MQIQDGYRAIMQEQSRDVHNAAIATKIVQLMDRLRDNSYEGQARRWIWELIQNAKDAAEDGVPVKIRVERWEDRVTFSHNGKPFRVKNVLSIINQVSSKSGSNDTSTGKFGTGFITTHLLSEQVQLQGILEDVSPGDGRMLPAKAFSILLDRSGSNAEEIIAAVQTALAEIERLDEQPDASPCGTYTTHFTYLLANDRAREAARAGLEDLQYTAPFALAFVDRVQEIVIVDHPAGSTRRYVRTGEQCLGTPHLSRFQMEQWTDDQQSARFLLLYRDHGGILAAPLDETNCFLPIHPNTPRIFVDFPLIGSEEFPLPVVFCHSMLLPDETRSWIPLSHKQESRNSIHNKAILGQAVLDSCQMMKGAEAEGIGRFSQICRTPPIPVRSDLDQVWMEQHVFAPFWDTMKERQVVSTGQGMQQLGQPGLVFPVSPDGTELRQIHRLIQALPGTLVPDETELEGWSAVFLPMERPPVPCLTLTEMASRAEPLFRQSGKQLPWLQRLYDTVLHNEELRARLMQGELALLPDQTAERTLHSLRTIWLDPGIEPQLKDAMESFNGLRLSSGIPPLPIRSLLVHRDFSARDIGVADYGVQELLNGLETRSDRYVRVLNYCYYSGEYHQAWYTGWRHMAACDQSDTWFRFAAQVFPEEMEGMTYAPSSYAGQSNVWRPSRLGLRRRICDSIKAFETMQGLQAALFPEQSMQMVQTWLGRFAAQAFAEGAISQVEDCGFLPDQYGRFHCYTALRQDGGIDEELKDITGLLSKHHNVTDIRTVLLDGTFHLPVEYMPVLRLQEVATAIGNAVETMLQNGGLAQTDQEMQMACAKLITWMNDHEEQTRTLFPRYSTEEARAQLVAPRAVANLIQTQKQLHQVLREVGVSSLEEMQTTMAELRVQNQKMDAFRTLYDMLQEAGVASAEALQTLLWQRGTPDDGQRWMADPAEYSSRAEWEQRCRQIGEAGEGEALRWLARQEVEQGAAITHACEREIRLERSGSHIRLCRADSDHYHQAGYDIVRTEEATDGTVAAQTYYEVKSTTCADRMSRFQLSPVQVQTAIQSGGTYRILHLYLDKSSLKLRDMVTVTDLLEQMKNQTIIPVDDPVTFRVS